MTLIGEVEEERIYEFRKRHCGNISLKLGFSGIGTKITVVCSCCGKELDITDYDSW